jgi:hypothetical protein
MNHQNCAATDVRAKPPGEGKHFFIENIYPPALLYV